MRMVTVEMQKGRIPENASLEWGGMEWQSPQTEWQVVTVVKGGGDQEKTVMSFEQVD